MKKNEICSWLYGVLMDKCESVGGLVISFFIKEFDKVEVCFQLFYPLVENDYKGIFMTVSKLAKVFVSGEIEMAYFYEPMVHAICLILLAGLILYGHKLVIGWGVFLGGIYTFFLLDSNPILGSFVYRFYLVSLKRELVLNGLELDDFIAFFFVLYFFFLVFFPMKGLLNLYAAFGFVFILISSFFLKAVGSNLIFDLPTFVNFNGNLVYRLDYSEPKYVLGSMVEYLKRYPSPMAEAWVYYVDTAEFLEIVKEAGGRSTGSFYILFCFMEEVMLKNVLELCVLSPKQSTQLMANIYLFHPYGPIIACFLCLCTLYPYVQTGIRFYRLVEDLTWEGAKLISPRNYVPYLVHIFSFWEVSTFVIQMLLGVCIPSILTDVWIPLEFLRGYSEAKELRTNPLNVEFHKIYMEEFGGKDPWDLTWNGRGSWSQYLSEREIE